MSESLTVDGREFETRVRVDGGIIHVYYDVDFEGVFNNREEIMNALEEYVRSEVDDVDEKEIKVYADTF